MNKRARKFFYIIKLKRPEKARRLNVKKGIKIDADQSAYEHVHRVGSSSYINIEKFDDDNGMCDEQIYVTKSVNTPYKRLQYFHFTKEPGYVSVGISIPFGWTAYITRHYHNSDTDEEAIIPEGFIIHKIEGDGIVTRLMNTDVDGLEEDSENQFNEIIKNLEKEMEFKIDIAQW